MNGNVLLLFHCETNTGYAISTLESVFSKAATLAMGPAALIHYAYSSDRNGRPAHVSNEASDIATVGYFGEAHQFAEFSEWARARNIRTVLALDLPIRSAVAVALRRAGVERIVSYWGASISDIYPWYLRPLRRAQFLASPARPEMFIFESDGMRERGVLGAGIPRKRTLVARIGVDCDRYRPNPGCTYAHDLFGIPRDRGIVFFSGHMEPRKGVHVLIDAFVSLFRSSAPNLHLLLVGNTSEDAERLSKRFVGTSAESRITLAGYRHDVALLQQSAEIGVIASTGWDSFTVSAAEMAATGVPLIVSDLPGLREAVVPGVTGERVPPGDVGKLASTIATLFQDSVRRSQYSSAARQRALTEFSEDLQVRTIASVLSHE